MHAGNGQRTLMTGLETIATSIFSSLTGAGIRAIFARVLENVFGHEIEEFSKKVYQATEAASTRFFKKYGEVFGKPHEGFLARETTWDLIYRGLFYGSSGVNAKNIIASLPADIPLSPPEHVVDDFLAILSEEMRKDWFLDKVLTEKQQSATTSARTEEMLQHLKNLTRSSCLGSAPKEIEIPFYGEGGKQLAHGRIYSMKGLSGWVLNAMVSGETMYSEYIFPDGATAYYEVDINGKCKTINMPYPLEEYSLELPSHLISTDRSRTDVNGMSERDVKLKWDGQLTVVYDATRRIIKIDIKTKFSLDHQNRRILILRPDRSSG